MAAIRNDCVENGIVSVPEFYAGKSVFVTGGTGFIGKVVVEKILYSCPLVGNIYILVRAKKKIEAKERMKAILDCPVFNRLKEKRPEDLEKIILIVGDIAAPDLGIHPDDEKLLTEKVSVVIHAAATVRFNDPFKVALNINLEGTRKVLELCHRMKNIKAFVHVSTVYCNAIDYVVEERLYPPPMEIKDAYQLAKDLDEDISKELLAGRPNTYTFTKAMAETLVNDLHGDIPTAIVRPSIVTPAMSEPVEGWVDNWYGATGLLFGVGKGYCKAVIGELQNIIDIIPVDYVANAIIIAAAKCRRSEDVTVLHAASSYSNPLSIGNLSDYFVDQCIMNCYNDLPFPGAVAIKYPWIVWVYTLFLEVIPAFLADSWLYVRKKPTKFINMQSKISGIRNTLSYFTTRSWLIETRGLSSLYQELSPEDRRLFPCDPSAICWRDYALTYFHGLNKYLIKGNH